jgi:predicted acetyltransferase/uridine phosphorylase
MFKEWERLEFMKIDKKEITFRNRTYLLKSPDIEDAELMIRYLQVVSNESHYLVREVDEVNTDIEKEKDIILNYKNSDHSFMINVVYDNRIVGNIGITALGMQRRISHRCSAGIAIIKEFSGIGLGEFLMKYAIKIAKESGFLQMELGAYSDNKNALRMYEKLGFVVTGRIPYAFILKDGRRYDEIQMVKSLTEDTNFKEYASYAIKDAPVLEYDGTKNAVIEPNHETLNISLPKKCVFAFLDETIDQYVKKHHGKLITQYETISKICNVYSININGSEICLAQAPVGAASATSMLDWLISYGVRKFFAVGSCGALEDVGEGEYYLPVEAVRQEGMSYRYLPARYSIKGNIEFYNEIESLLKDVGISYKKCKTWTTDGLFRETKELTNRRKAEGCSVVEMECASLMSCAQFRGIEFAQLLYTGDSLRDPDQWDSRDFGRGSIGEALEIAVKVVARIKNNRLCLKLVESNDKDKIMKYKDEFIAYANKYNNGKLTGAYSLDGTAAINQYSHFEEWFQNNLENRSEDTVKDGFVTASTFIALDDDNNIVGMLDLRHRLNKYLNLYGGHIGYSVRPSQRNKGYAKEMLRLGILEARKRNIEDILITCYKENEGSRRVILANGGELENEVEEPNHVDGNNSGVLQRYWIHH